MNRILVVEDKESLALMLQETLRGEGFEVDCAATGKDAIRRLSEGRRYAAVLTDLRLPAENGIAVLEHAKQADPDCPVIVMTAFGTIENAVEAMKIGAHDFIQKPIDIDYLILLIRRCAEYRSLRFENYLLKEEYQKKYGFPAIVGDSPPMRDLSQAIQKVAVTDSTVLLQGESGTGKELFARAIHRLSNRKERPFVAINCAAIPDTLIENELFGHEKGSYTGAASRQIGKFELADGGTIFLDEIGELGLPVQSKILRVLQERTFERIGGTHTIDVDVRVICATNRDLEAAIREGSFREDLFFRIHVFPVTIPPLRERKEDLEAMIDHFLLRLTREMGKKSIGITDRARALLHEYDWPGNVRELENCLERAAILCDRDRIDAADLNLRASAARSEVRLREHFDFSGTLGEVVARASAQVERSKINDVLRHHKNKNEAADILGISYRTLLNKIKEHHLDSEGGSE